MLFQTIREAPKEADTVSHALMIRSSLTRQIAAGFYEFLPYGWKAVQKVASVIREEMNRAGAQEVMLPHVTPRGLWEESGRWVQYGKELFRLEDRHERQLALGPTHEETMTDMVRAVVRSHRRLPVTVYQIQAKFRDEIRPRFGVMRSREFLMKDAYSFDASEKGAEQSYQSMRDAYNRIFRRLGLKYREVMADTGLIGGSFSQEFMVLAEKGEEVVVACEGCDYAANLDMASPASLPGADSSGTGACREVETPGAKTAQAVAGLLKKSVESIGKILFYRADGALVGIMIRGGHVLNESKLQRHLGVQRLAMADSASVEKELGVPVGFIGPVGLERARIIADRDLMRAGPIVTGANRPDFHLVDVLPGRDFKPAEVVQLRDVVETDSCPECGKRLTMTRGIEVGHVFMLGDKYSKAMKATFLDEAGKEKVMVMGCYGIGITRIVAAAIEQNHDERGIIWPREIAPYRAVILPLGSDSEVRDTAENLYRELCEAGVEVLIDDRSETPGVKFNDADLMGTPVQIIVGKTLKAKGKVELKFRGGDKPEELVPGDVKDRLKD